MINPGTAIWSAGNITGANGAVISNLFGATFMSTFDGNAASGPGTTPIFINAGLFQKTDGTAPLGTTTIDFQFHNTGTVEVRTNTLRYTASGMPPGITFVGSTRMFSGTPTQAGVFPVQVIAKDGGSPNLTATNAFTITINPATLTVTADGKSKTYGAADPVFTASYAGFVNNETPAVLGGTLSFARAPGENVGSYLITPGGLTSANYTIAFNPGTLSITDTASVILSLTSADKSTIVITWNAVSNVTYRVQYKTDLKVSNWTDLIGDVLASSSLASKTDLKTTTNRFYRVQVLP